MKYFSLVGVFLALMVMGNARADDKQDVINFADSLAQNALEIVTNDDFTAGAKQRKLEALFESRVDIDWVSQFVLGKYWRSATPEQQQEYQQNYKAFVLKYYTAKLTDYSGQEYQIKGVRAEGDPGEYLLSMELVNTNEPNVLVDYRIRKENDDYQIFDIVIEGVSMITTQRSEFASVIGNKGLDYLISALAKKAEAAKGA